MFYEEQTEEERGVRQAGQERELQRHRITKKSGSKEVKLRNVRREEREKKGTRGGCEVRGRKENAGKEKRRGGQ